MTSRFTTSLLAALVLVASCANSSTQAPVPLPADTSTTITTTADTANSDPNVPPADTTALESELSPSTTAADPSPPPSTTEMPEPFDTPKDLCGAQEHYHTDTGCHTHGPEELLGNDAAPVVCGEGLERFDEYVAFDDNGCRPEACDSGRGDDGYCLLVEEEQTAQLTSDDPTETVPWDEYGLEGCAEVSPGVCDLDGVIYCHDTSTGWTECPGQPDTDATCEHDADDPLSLTGTVQTTGEIPTVTLSPATWSIGVCVWSNDVTTGQAASFLVVLREQVAEGAFIRKELVNEPSIVTGEWFLEHIFTTTFFEDFNREQIVFEVRVTPEGGGYWVITFNSND